VDRIQEVKETGETIKREVLVYFREENDLACTINNGFVDLHNAAAEMRLPRAAGDAHAAAIGIRPLHDSIIWFKKMD
jgi:hypothetical protein